MAKNEKTTPKDLTKDQVKDQTKDQVNEQTGKDDKLEAPDKVEAAKKLGINLETKDEPLKDHDPASEINPDANPPKNEQTPPHKNYENVENQDGSGDVKKN